MGGEARCVGCGAALGGAWTVGGAGGEDEAGAVAPAVIHTCSQASSGGGAPP